MTYKVQSSMRVLSKDGIVKDLIDNSTGEWNRPIVFQIFNSQEAKAILKLPLGRGRIEDKLIWYPSRNGQFSVKIAYHLELNRLKTKDGESSSGDRNYNYWHVIWKLSNLGFVKYFL